MIAMLICPPDRPRVAILSGATQRQAGAPNGVKVNPSTSGRKPKSVRALGGQVGGGNDAAGAAGAKEF